jgi:hypothetical protein
MRNLLSGDNSDAGPEIESLNRRILGTDCGGTSGGQVVYFSQFFGSRLEWMRYAVE